MDEGPVTTGSLLSYQILIFIILIIWSFMSFEIAQVQLLPLYETPFAWIAWAMFALVSIIPCITVVAWRMKTRIRFSEPEWSFRERDVSLSEYEAMMKQYRSQYRSFLSIVDYYQIFLAILLSAIAIAIPFPLMRANIFLIAASPLIFGFLVLMFGLICSSIMFKLIPNEATSYFPIVSGGILRPWIELMEKTPGISWSGVNLLLGESGGYYTIRDVCPISRIEGIESVSKIKCVLDESGHPQKTLATITLDDSDGSRVIDEHVGVPSLKKLTQIVHKTLQTYISSKGADEILNEVLEEVAYYLKRQDNAHNHKLS